MGTRILARVLASRLRWWSEHLELTDDDQSGFRPGRSTMDAIQVIVRIEEDMEDLIRRRERAEDALIPAGDPVARLLDLRKAYPRVNKSALWNILERYRLRGSFLDTIRDLHKITTYAVKGKEKDSES